MLILPFSKCHKRILKSKHTCSLGSGPHMALLIVSICSNSITVSYRLTFSQVKGEVRNVLSTGYVPFKTNYDEYFSIATISLATKPSK